MKRFQCCVLLTRSIVCSGTDTGLTKAEVKGMRLVIHLITGQGQVLHGLRLMRAEPDVRIYDQPSISKEVGY